MSMRFITSDDPREIARQARCLADALDRLAVDDGPSLADLAAAPLLDDWRQVARIAPALAGVVTGHPLIGRGRPALTSEVFAIDGQGKWARTWSRFYRLGSPMPDRKLQ